MGWKLFKKKSKRKLTSPDPPSAKKTLPKPTAVPITRTPSDATTVHGGSVLSEESNSLRSIGAASSVRNDSQPTLNVIEQAPDDFQDSIVTQKEQQQVPIKHNIVDLDESVRDDDDFDNDNAMQKDQGVVNALGEDEPILIDNQMLDVVQEDIPTENQQEGDQGVSTALGGEEEEEDGVPSAEAADEFNDYGDGAPSGSQDVEDEERVISADEESDGNANEDTAAYYDYGEAAPSSHVYSEDEEEAKVIPNHGHDAASDGTGGSLDGMPNGDAAALHDDGNAASDSHEGQDQTDEAAKYGYGDAAPTVGAQNDLDSQVDGPVPSSTGPVAQPLEEPTNLYQAKKQRLKQRRMSMTTVEQRTERAAARRNKLLLKKLLKKEMSEEDDYIQTHLGCDDKGMCLRHPNMTIVGKVREFRFESVYSCKICHSEQKAGGIARQRKSMSMVIGDIKQMQKDRVSWRKRTQVMHNGKEYDSDEDSDVGSSDSSQSLDSLEKITGFFAEDGDEHVLSRRDDAWKEKVSGRVAQVRAWDGKAALKCNPVFAKYFRMISLGVPKDAVKQACEFDGWDPRVMDLDPNRPLLDQLYSTRVWKKSEKEDLLLNIRLCMGQESKAEQAGDSLLEITDSVFAAYVKKKESIELHRQQMKREEEAQKWIGSGQSLLKKTSKKRPDTAKDEEKEKEADKEPISEGKAVEPMEFEERGLQSLELEQIDEGTENEEDESEDGDHPIVAEPVTEPESPNAGDTEPQTINVSGEVATSGDDKAEWSDGSGDDFMMPLDDGGKIRDGPSQKNKSIDSEANYSVAGDGTTDDEADFTEPLGGGGKTRDKPMEKNKSMDSAAMYSVAGDGSTEEEMDDDALKMAFEGTESLSSVGEIFDDWDAEDYAMDQHKDVADGVVEEPGGAKNDAIEGPTEGGGVIEATKDVPGDGEGGIIEGPIEIPAIARPRLEDDNMSVDSDMTSETWKKSKRSSRRQQRKEIWSAHRSLEKKDVIVASLVEKVQRLRQQVADQNKDCKDDARSLAEELRETKRLIAEKDIIAAGLEKQIARQERESNEKWRIVEEQTIQIMRLKQQVESEEGAIAPDSKRESSSSKVTRSSGKSKSSSSKKKKSSSSSSKDKKRSSKDSKSHSKSKSSSKSKRKENLDRAHLREVFKKTVRKLIIILRSFLYSQPVDKEMAMDRKSFRRSSMRMDAWVPPTEWNEFMSDDDDDDCKPKPPKPPSPTMDQQRGAASVLATNKDRTTRQQKLSWRDDDDICKVIFVDRIPAEFKKELFYNGEDIQRFRLDKFMEDHEDEFELVDEDDSDYSEEWIEEEYSGDEEEIEYIDEEVVSDEGSYIEEEIVTDDEYELEEATPVQQARRRSLL